jgi:hypothetical protein
MLSQNSGAFSHQAFGVRGAAARTSHLARSRGCACTRISRQGRGGAPHPRGGPCTGTHLPLAAAAPVALYRCWAATTGRGRTGRYISQHDAGGSTQLDIWR